MRISAFGNCGHVATSGFFLVCLVVFSGFIPEHELEFASSSCRFGYVGSDSVISSDVFCHAEAFKVAFADYVRPVCNHDAGSIAFTPLEPWCRNK